MRSECLRETVDTLPSRRGEVRVPGFRCLREHRVPGLRTPGPTKRLKVSGQDFMTVRAEGCPGCH